MSELLSFRGPNQGSGSGNLRVLHDFELHSFFKIVFGGDGEGVSGSVKGEVHGVTSLEEVSDSLLV